MNGTANGGCGGGGGTWVVVSGASRGLGAAICEGLASHLGPGSVVLGLARSKHGLDSTAARVVDVNPLVKFVPLAMDLSTPSREDLHKALMDAFTTTIDLPPSRAMIFHNAGSLKDLTYLREMKDLSKITSYFQFNVSSVITLNAVFLNMMSRHPGVPVTVVNISSLCALEAFKSWGLYCSAKAARNMLFRVLALEDPNLRVLNYAPGPLDNDMQAIARSETKDEEVQNAFKTMKEEGKLLSCSESAEKLLTILERDSFQSGAHVDFFDE